MKFDPEIEYATGKMYTATPMENSETLYQRGILKASNSRK